MVVTVSRDDRKKKQRARGTAPLNVDVFDGFRALVDTDARVSGQHNMRARLVTLALEIIAAMPAADRRAEAMRVVHRGEEAQARRLNADLWPVQTVRGAGQLPEKTRRLLAAVLDDAETRAHLAAWLDAVSQPPPPAPPAAGDGNPGGPGDLGGTSRPSGGSRPSSTRSRGGSGKRRRSS